MGCVNMNLNDTHRAIDILHDVVAGRRDAIDILFALAKHHPEALVAAMTPIKPWVGGVLEAMRHGNTVEAIKNIRVVYGCGLKEAKDLHDSAKAKFPDEAEAGAILSGGPIPF